MLHSEYLFIRFFFYGWFTESALDVIFIGDAVSDLRLSHQTIFIFQFIVDTLRGISIISSTINQRSCMEIRIHIDLSVIVKVVYVIWHSGVIVEVFHLLFAPIHADTTRQSIMTIHSLSVRWKFLNKTRYKWILEKIKKIYNLLLYSFPLDFRNSYMNVRNVLFMDAHQLGFFTRNTESQYIYRTHSEAHNTMRIYICDIWVSRI